MKRLFFILLVTLPLISHGMEPVIIGLDTNTTYTVPVDKVLLIEHIFSRAESHQITLKWTLTLNGTTNNICSYGSSDNPYHVAFIRPLKIPGGTEIKAQYVGLSDGGLTICGILVDLADLYASIESQADGVLCENGNFTFDVLARSPRPSAIELQGSTDLTEWHPIVAAEVAKIDANTRSVSIPVAGNEKYFVKSLLTSVAQ